MKLFLWLLLCVAGQQIFGQTTSELLARASKAYDADNYEAALTDLNTILNSEPNNLAALKKRMWVYYFKDADDLAYTEADKLTKLEPSYPDAFNVRGLIKHSRTQYGAAALDYEQALRLNPTYTIVFYNRALSLQALDMPLSQVLPDYDLYFQGSLQTPSALKKTIRLIDYCISKGAALTTCAPYFEKIKKEHPDSPIGYFGYAASYSKSQFRADKKISWEAIDADLKRAAELLPKQPEPMAFVNNLLGNTQASGQTTEAVLERAIQSIEEKDYDGALADLNAILNVEPNNLKALQQRMWANYYKKNYDSAYTEADNLIKLDPTFDGAFNVRGLIKHSRKDYTGAVSDFDQVLRLDPDYTVVFHNRALSKMSLNMPSAQILADYDLYFQKSLKKSAALEKLDRLIDHCIAKDEALTICAPYFEKMKNEHPDSAIGFFGYAAAYSRSQNQKDEKIPWTAIIADYKRAAELSPQSPEPLTFLADLLVGRGDYENAIKYSMQSADIDGNWAWNHLIRGDAYRYQKNYDKAVYAYDEALRVNPSSEGAKTGKIAAQRAMSIAKDGGDFSDADSDLAMAGEDEYLELMNKLKDLDAQYDDAISKIQRQIEKDNKSGVRANLFMNGERQRAQSALDRSRALIKAFMNKYDRVLTNELRTKLEGWLKGLPYSVPI